MEPGARAGAVATVTLDGLLSVRALSALIPRMLVPTLLVGGSDADGLRDDHERTHRGVGAR